MIKASFTIGPYSACPKEDGILDRECIIMPAYRGCLITVSRGREGWETVIDRQAVPGTVFGDSLWEYINTHYGYDLNELSFIVNHRSIPETAVKEHLLNTIKNDKPLKWELYHLHVYYRQGSGVSTNLPLVQHEKALLQSDIDDMYAELAERSERDKQICGMYIARRNPGTNYYRWYRRVFSSVLKVTITGYVPSRRQLIATTGSGKRLLLLVDRYGGERMNINEGNVGHLMGKPCLITYTDLRELPNAELGDHTTKMIANAYNVRLVMDNDIDWEAHLHGVIDIETALAQGSLLFREL